jgi:hypothetical protein
MAAALFLYGVARDSAATVRRRLGGLGYDSRWRTLARWCDAAAGGQLFEPPRGLLKADRRAVAAAVAWQLVALSPATAGPDLERAMLAAERLS